MRRQALMGVTAAVALAAVLGGCSKAREALGFNKQAPDEFQVVARAPLSMPPDYSLRPPEPGAVRPQEGTTRDQAERALLGSNGSADAATSTTSESTGMPAPGELPPVDSAPLTDTAWADATAPDSSDSLSGFSVGGGLGSSGDQVGSSAQATAPASSAAETALLQQAGADKIDPTIRRRVNAETAEQNENDESFIDRLIFWQDNPPGEIVNPADERKRLQENAALGKPVTAGETPTIERRRKGWLEGVF